MQKDVIHILGAGSIGLLLAMRLSAHQEVRLIRRPGQAPSRPSYRLTEGEGCRTQALLSIAPEDVQQVRKLIVCTKAYDALAALRPLKALLGDAHVLLMQNGMGSQEEVAANIPSLSLHAASSTEGAYRRGSLEVVHAGRGLTYIGKLSGQDHPWAATFTTAGLEAEAVPDIKRYLFDKLRVNALINPLTALYRCRNGELLTHAEAYPRMQALGQETDAILEAAGYRFSTPALAAAEAVARRTAANYSSMYQDAQAGRRLEIDYINVYLVRLAERLGRKAAAHRRICEDLRAFIR